MKLSLENALRFENFVRSENFEKTMENLSRNLAKICILPTEYITDEKAEHTTLWRIGGRAGERKSSNGRQTFKFLLNFPRAYTPHDATTACCVLGFFLRYNILSARYKFWQNT